MKGTTETGFRKTEPRTRQYKVAHAFFTSSVPFLLTTLEVSESVKENFRLSLFPIILVLKREAP